MPEPLIVVPLDGSELSEAAVPHAVALAKLMEARLFLVTVWDGAEHGLLDALPSGREMTQHGEQFHQDYLDAVAKRLRSEDVEVETDVLIGEPGDEIARVLQLRDPRMLVLATHGRSGPSRWLYGSVAHELVREAPVPTLVVGPKTRPSAGIRKILVPLDSSPLSESALQPAIELAERCGASLTIAEVIQIAGQAVSFGVPMVYIPEVEQAVVEAATTYLRAVEKSLRTSVPVEALVLRGPPAEMLLDFVEEHEIDLVVMSSHSRTGVSRVFLGSVAGRMLGGAAPVLLVRPEGVTQVVHARRGRYCHNCGRASPYIEVLPEDMCLRCGQHLHACGNCVYFDGLACLIQRPEVSEPYPGQHCAYFQFRETESPGVAKGGA